MNPERFEKNPIVKKSFEFAIEVVIFCETLNQNKQYTIAKQLGKSGTSIGANVFEAQNAESKADFIHKMKIAAKEAEETQYWLMLCSRIPSYPQTDTLSIKLEDIHKILGKIISSSKK